MISRVAVLPQPPLLVPELMGASVGSSEPLRQACRHAVRRLTDEARHWLAIGPSTGASTVRPSARGSFVAYGADVAVALDERPGTDGAAHALPLSALVAGWLRAQADAASVRVELVAERASPLECRDMSARLASSTSEQGLLVLGDGSNRLGARAPGGHDERAAAFEDTVCTALGAADTGTLLGLDAALAEELGASGRAPWQVLGALVGGHEWRGELLYSGAPFGVGYHVAVWERS